MDISEALRGDQSIRQVILTSEETCIICLETMTCGESAKKLTCGHVFLGDITSETCTGSLGEAKVP